MHRILVVGDSCSALTALTQQLEQNHFKVTCASSTSFAVDQVSQFRPDCILLGYQIPEPDWPSVCQSFKAVEGQRHIPVLVLTSKLETAQLLAAIAAGADDYVANDSDIRLVVAKIHAMLRLKRINDEIAQLKRATGIKQIIATYNHEFNNPLAIAIGNVQYLQLKTTDPELQIRAQRAFESLERMATLVKKIRALRDYIDESYDTSETMVSLNKAS